MSDFITTLHERGFIHACTNIEELRVLSRAGSIRPYIGFDLTADSLHVGSLIQLMVLRWAAKHEITPIALLGTFTTRVGDPTGRTESRPVLDGEQIMRHQNGILSCIQRVVKSQWFQSVRNGEWLDSMTADELLFKYGPMFSVNRMLSMDSVKTRLDSQEHMSFLEFTYSIIQAIDFHHLNQRGVNLQIGGSDQWSNIIGGVDIIRRLSNRIAYGLTTPLMTNSAGAKMGKTAGGAIWLDPEKTPPNDFFQFWRNVEDTKVEEFLRLFTELPLSEIATIMQGDINEAKKVLAFCVTDIVHGRNAASKAKKNAEALFEGGDTSEIELWKFEDTPMLRGGALSRIVADCHKVSVSEAKRLITQRAVKLNGDLIHHDTVLSTIPWNMDHLLQVGKRRFYKFTLGDLTH